MNDAAGFVDQFCRPRTPTCRRNHFLSIIIGLRKRYDLVLVLIRYMFVGFCFNVFVWQYGFSSSSFVFFWGEAGGIIGVCGGVSVDIFGRA